MQTKQVSLKERIKKTHGKAKFAGFLYSFGSILLLAVLFLPLITVGQPKEAWALSALTFFNPLTHLDDLGLNYNTLKNIPIFIVFLAMLLTALINMFKCFGQGKDLHKKNPTKLNGYNRPYFAMVAMGKTYSFTLWTIIVGYLGIYLTGATLDGMLVAIALGVALLIHFWAALVGANMTMYDVHEDTITEEKRVGGVGKHFLCNLIQVIAAAAIVYFYGTGTTVKSLMKLLTEEGGIDLLLQISNLAPLLAQVLLLIFIVYIVKNATGIKEYLHDGIYTPGIRCFATLCWFAAIIAIAWVALDFVVGSGALNIVALLIAAVSIIAALLDAATKPSKKALKAAEAAEAAKAANAVEVVEAVPAPTAAKPGSYKVALSGVSQPAIFMQPNGQPLMVMPMMAGSQPAPMYQEPIPAPVNNDPGYAYPYNSPYQTATPVNNPYAPAYWGSNGMPHGFQQPAAQEASAEASVAAPEAAEEQKVDKKAAKKKKEEEKKLAKKEKADKKAADKAAKKEKADKKAADKAAKKEAKKKVDVAALPVAQPAVAPAPAPAPAELQPAPSPAVLASGVAVEEKKDEIVVPAGLPEGLPPNAVAPVTEEILPPIEDGAPAIKDEDRKKHDVVCPDCGKKLSVKDGAMAYRCPECGGVFQLQKTKKVD